MSDMDIEINDAGVLVGGVPVPGVLVDEVSVDRQANESVCRVHITLLADSVVFADGSEIRSNARPD